MAGSTKDVRSTSTSMRSNNPEMYETSEEALNTSMKIDEINDSEEFTINWDEAVKSPVCTLGQAVAMASEGAERDESGYLFLDELITLEFGLDSCCTNCICGLKKKNQGTEGGPK
eukprot:13798688-Ditylum_brightwellii.AAC.1